MKKREKHIDLLKAILTIGMVLGHVFQLLAQSNEITNTVTNYINLISFSGFLFCFGYSAYIAYLSKDFEQAKTKLWKNICRITVAFWISGLFYKLLIIKKYNILDYIKMIFFLELPGYSEFLASFAVLNLLILSCFKFLKLLVKRSKNIILIAIVSLIFALLPKIDIDLPWINLLIKTGSVSFPILPYINLFFIGIYFAKEKPKFNVLSLLTSLLCFGIYFILKQQETMLVLSSRFPPGIMFVMASYVFIYLYYYISKYIVLKFETRKLLRLVTFIR